MLWVHVHDHISHRKESRSHQRLGEKVSEVIRRAHERYNQRVVLHLFPNEEVPATDMFSSRVMLGIISQVTAGLIIHT